MNIHFICRGNAFRSRIAEAYVKSLHLNAIKVKSSGTAAQKNAAINGPLAPHARYVLARHNLLEHTKPSWDQLEPARLSEDDIVIFMNRRTYDEAVELRCKPTQSVIWDIADTDDYLLQMHLTGFTPETLNAFAEKTYQKIIKKTNRLLKELGHG